VQSLRAFIDRLGVENDLKVKVILGSNNIITPRIEYYPKGVEYVYLQSSGKTGWGRVIDALVSWRYAINIAVSESPPDFIIAVDKWGLFCSSLVRPKAIYGVCYFNLELRVQSETHFLSRKLANMLEGYLHRGSRFSIIQDKWRADFIKEEHRLKPNHLFLLLPNSPSGQAIERKNAYLRQYYKIPDESLIVLYIGSLTDHFMISEMIEAINEIEFVTLIVHSPPSFTDIKLRNKIKSRVDQLTRVFLSEKLLDPYEMARMIQSADIGIGLFRPEPGNFINEVLMGFSSGKLSQYLQYGKPIITSKFPSTNWVEENGCGRCVEIVTKENLHKILLDISSRRKSYSVNATRFFNESLLVDHYLDNIVDEIKQQYKQ